MDSQTRRRLIQKHLDAIAAIEATPIEGDSRTWPPTGYYWLFHIVAGMTLGMIGAAASLTLNILGSLAVGQHPLKLIQVYLTFPMGEAALEADSGVVLFVGCVLYLVTGGLYGVVFHVIMSSLFPKAAVGKRWAVGSVVGLVLWVVNFYLLLSWLQPVLQGGNWITTQVPFYVGAATHLVFAWTMLLVESWGRFEPAA